MSWRLVSCRGHYFNRASAMAASAGASVLIFLPTVVAGLGSIVRGYSGTRLLAPLFSAVGHRFVSSLSHPDWGRPFLWVRSTSVAAILAAKKGERHDALLQLNRDSHDQGLSA
jgi:hypothetical protein